MADDTKLNTIFTADTSDVESKINGMINTISKLGNIGQAIASQLKLPSTAIKELSQSTGFFTETSGRMEKAMQLAMDRARGLVPSMEDLDRISSILGKDFIGIDTSASVLVKGLMALENQGTAAQKALSDFASVVGINSDKLVPFSNSLKIVHDNLSSIPEVSPKYVAAQEEIVNSTTLSSRAIQLQNGDIASLKEGYVALIDGLSTVGTTISSQEEFLKSLGKENKKLAETVREVIEAKKGDKEATQSVIANAVQLVDSVGKVRTALKSSAEETIKQEGTLRLMGSAALSVADINKKLATEQGLLTKSFYNEDTILKVLNGDIKAVVPSLLDMISAKYKSREIIQNLVTEYPKWQSGIASVTGDQEFLSSTIKMFNEVYGPVYGKVLQDMASNNKLMGDELVQTANKIEIVAQTTQGLIDQAGLYAQQVVRETEVNTLLNASRENQSEVINKIIDDYSKYITVLQSEESVLHALSIAEGTSKESISAYADAVVKGSLAHGDFSESSRELITTSQGIKSSQEQLRIAYDGTGESSKALVKTSDALGGASQSLTGYFERLKRVFEEHTGATGSASKATDTFTEAQYKVNKAADQAQGYFSRLLDTIKNFIQFQIASTIVSAITHSFINAVQAAADFDQSLHSLKAVTGSTASEMAGMNDVIKETAASSIYSTEAIGKGLQNMAQAGLTTSESVSAIKAASNLATGTLEKLENTVDLVTSTLVSYGINALEAGRVTDILAIACNKSKLDIDKLRTSLNYVGVIAAQSGLSLEQTTASLMTLADRGMKASTIGTGFRQVLDKLIAPNEKLREAYQAHGIALEKISPLTAGYEEALKNLSIALYDSDTKTIDTAKAFELFGIRGAQAAAILVQAYTSGEYKEAMNSFNESGTAAKMAAEQMLGLGAMWDNLVAKASALLASIGEGGLTAALKGVIKVFASFIDVIQSFLNMDFGNFGVLIQILTAFGALLGTTYAAILLYNAGMKLFATAQLYFQVAIDKTTASFLKLTAAMMLNPIMLAITAIAAAALALKIYAAHLDSVIESHNKLVNAAKQMTGTIDLLQKSMQGMTAGSVEYETLLKRLKSEYPELAKEIEKVAVVNDISTLSYKELSEAMEKVRQVKLNEAIEENLKALQAISDKAEGVGAIFVYLGEVVDRIKQMFSALVTVLNFVATAHQKIAEIINPVAQEMAKSSKETAEAIKNTAKAYVDAGNDINKSLEEQKAASLAKLEDDVKNGKVSVEVYREIVKEVNTTYDKIAARLQASKVHYAKFSNDIQGIYGNLSAKQRAEIQSVVDEEEKAVIKFTKFGKDKKLSAEEIETEIYAIRLQYQLKALGLLSDSTKKEYETQKEKFSREEGLIENKLALVASGIEKEKKIYDNLAEYRDGHNKKDYASMVLHGKNIETLLATQEDLKRAQYNVTFEYQKKLMTDAVNEIKTNTALQLTLTQGFELEKIKLIEAEADAVLAANNLMLKAEQDYIAEKIAAGKASKKDIENSAEREKALIMEVTKAQTASINARLTDVKMWMDRSNEYQAQRLEYSKDIIKQEQEAIKRSYDEQVADAKSALDRKLVLISTEQKSTDILYKYHSEQEQAALASTLKTLETEQISTEEFVKQTFDAKKKYFDEGLQRYQEDSNKQINIAGFTTKSIIEIEAQKQKAKIDYYKEMDILAKDNLAKNIALEEQSLQNTIKIIDEKYLLEQTTNQSLMDLQNVQADFSKTIQARILQATAEGNSARIALAQQETEATTTEYSKREEALLNQITRSGKTVLEDITLRGSALVKETALTTKELSARQISWVKFGEEVFRVVDKQTIAVQLGAAQQKSYVKKSIDDQIISLRTVTTESIAELKKQGAQYEVSNGQVVKIYTGTYSEIKKNFKDLTDEEKKKFIVSEANKYSMRHGKYLAGKIYISAV